MTSPSLLGKLATGIFCFGLTGCFDSTSTTANTNTTVANAQNSAKTAQSQKPNIVIFYVDDLGYGDLSSYGMTATQTPNIDALATDGIRYTDAHSSAATCTPSRYSLLTGQYAFRNNAAILPGDAPLIVDPAIPTLPKMMQRAGYKTAVVGKWHLGLGRGYVDWNTAVKPGPLELGFDYSFLMPATGDRVPTVYLENHHVVNLDPNDPITISYYERIGERPVGTESPQLLKQQADLQHSRTIVNGISRIGWMAGGHSAEWVDEEFPSVFTDKAIEFIQDAKDQPFLLYFPFHDIHVPRVPNDMFAGKSGMGPRGDAILQVDWMTGRIVEALKDAGVYNNTLIVFSSDNGPVMDDGYADQAEELRGEHDPAGGFRGGKYSAYEAGTRVPMIVTYPNGLVQGGESSALVSHIDLYRSLAELVSVDLAEGEAIDSVNLLDALLDSRKPGRNEMVEESFTVSLRSGKWKFIEPFTGTTPDWLANKAAIENGLQAQPQLFDLSEDVHEQNDVAGQFPEVVEQLQVRLQQIRQMN